MAQKSRLRLCRRPDETAAIAPREQDFGADLVRHPVRRGPRGDAHSGWTARASAARSGSSSEPARARLPGRQPGWPPRAAGHLRPAQRTRRRMRCRRRRVCPAGPRKLMIDRGLRHVSRATATALLASLVPTFYGDPLEPTPMWLSCGTKGKRGSRLLLQLYIQRRCSQAVGVPVLPVGLYSRLSTAAIYVATADIFVAGHQNQPGRALHSTNPLFNVAWNRYMSSVTAQYGPVGLVELAALADPDLVAHAIGSAVRIPDQLDGSEIDGIAEMLRRPS